MFTSSDERAVRTLKTELGSRRSSLSPENRLSALRSRPYLMATLKNVPPLPNCCRVCLLSVVVELKAIQVTCGMEKFCVVAKGSGERQW